MADTIHKNDEEDLSKLSETEQLELAMRASKIESMSVEEQVIFDRELSKRVLQVTKLIIIIIMHWSSLDDFENCYEMTLILIIWWFQMIYDDWNEN